MIKSATYVRPKPVQRGKRRSSYRQLLERLLHSPENSVLRVKNMRARHTFEKEAKALGYAVEFAQDDGWLYVKIGGAVTQEPPSGQRAEAGQNSVLEALQHAPMTATEVARVLRSDSASCEAILSRLVVAGFVECDEGLGNQAIYRAM
jgi:hypothetical protein